MCNMIKAYKILNENMMDEGYSIKFEVGNNYKHESNILAFESIASLNKIDLDTDFSKIRIIEVRLVVTSGADYKYIETKDGYASSGLEVVRELSKDDIIQYLQGELLAIRDQASSICGSIINIGEEYKKSYDELCKITNKKK